MSKEEARTFLSNLIGIREDLIEILSKNKDNSHKIISGLYSDPSHFIYELLQNADDAGASEVVFELTKNDLSIMYNGREFNCDDVEAITTVGSSTKDGANAIGTFGAGFKSVFAITKTPHIYSGDFNFKITNLIVPEEIEAKAIKQYNTKITLPFDHSVIPSDKAKAYQQSSVLLQQLQSESMLFLHNIEKITWKTEEASGHYEVKINNNKASLVTKVTNEDSRIEEYFLCKKEIEIGEKSFDIVVAYLLSDDKVVAPKHDKLFVFFPTKVETGFKFLVHAPYKTTPSRETIPFGDEQNKLITKELSMLVAESIIKLKENGLLRVVDVLALLPIDSEVPIYSDNERPLYRLAFDQVKSVFAKEDLLPTVNGNYECSNNVILAEKKELTELLDDADCLKLFSKKSWLSTDINSNKIEKLKAYLVDKLEIKEITMVDFCSVITKEFIENKPDSWMLEFYAIINSDQTLYAPATSQDGSRNKGILRERPIIRLEDEAGSHIHICSESDSGDMRVYLPLPEATGESRFKTAKRELVKDKQALEFLRNIGLTEPDDLAEIEQSIILKYNAQKSKKTIIDKEEYLKDLEWVVRIWNKTDKADDKTKIVDLLKKCYFVRCKNQIGDSSFEQAETTYFDSDNLLKWFDGNPDKNIYFIDPEIKLSTEQRKFMESLGVKYSPKISGAEEINIASWGNYEKSIGGFNPMFNIDGLEYALKNISFERSTFLWGILLKNANKLKGHTKSSGNQYDTLLPGVEQTSVAMKLLNGNKWLYDATEKIIDLPAGEITCEQLSNNYQKEDVYFKRLFEALGLKLDPVKEFEDKTGYIVAISEGERKALEDFRQSQKEKQTANWKPECSPEDVIDIYFKEGLSAQDPQKITLSQNNSNSNADSPKKPHDFKASGDWKEKIAAIGDWGERVAVRYLKGEYPANDVVWLNPKGRRGTGGTGRDVVIKDGEKEIAHYEIKSTIFTESTESEAWVKISGPQWKLAAEKVDSYNILRVSNVGKQQPIIRKINNPFGLCQEGKLYTEEYGDVWLHF